MALFENTLYGQVDKEKQAIERIRTFNPTQSGDLPYYVAYSGGKDSDAIRILCELAGVKFDLVHNLTTADAPETINYIEQVGASIEYPEISMWRLIEKKLIPPTRIVRYCCSELKERGGKGRWVMTGVRWDESVRRKKTRGSLEMNTAKIGDRLILNADNEDSRRIIENCTIKGKRILNPIVDWSTSDVWEFLNYYGCASNPLYQCGFNRIGCIGCPMAGDKRYVEFARWPKYRQNYIRAFGRMLKAREAAGKPTTWESAEQVFAWWMGKYTLDKYRLQIIMNEYEEAAA